MEDFIPIFAMFAVFGTITAIVFGPQVLKYREKRDMQETIRHAVDKGQQLPPELIDAMKKAYPQVTDGALSLDIGAKVNKGEMKW